MNTSGPMYLHPFPVEIFIKFDLLERAMFFYWGGGGTQNGLNLAAKRKSNEMTASDWSILAENAI